MILFALNFNNFMQYLIIFIMLAASKEAQNKSSFYKLQRNNRWMSFTKLYHPTAGGQTALFRVSKKLKIRASGKYVTLAREPRFRNFNIGSQSNDVLSGSVYSIQYLVSVNGGAN
jgi:hypothetical protein